MAHCWLLLLLLAASTITEPIVPVSASRLGFIIAQNRSHLQLPACHTETEQMNLLTNATLVRVPCSYRVYVSSELDYQKGGFQMRTSG